MFEELNKCKEQALKSCSQKMNNAPQVALSYILYADRITPDIQSFIRDFLASKHPQTEIILVLKNKKLINRSFTEDLNNVTVVALSEINDGLNTLFSKIKGKYLLFISKEDHFCLKDSVINLLQIIQENIVLIPTLIKSTEAHFFSNSFFDPQNYRNDLKDSVYFQLLHKLGIITCCYRKEYLNQFSLKKIMIEQFEEIIQNIPFSNVMALDNWAAERNHLNNLSFFERVKFKHLLKKKKPPLNTLKSAHNKVSKEDPLAEFGVKTLDEFILKLDKLIKDNSLTNEIPPTSRKDSYLEDRQEILSSPLWDENYYLSQFNYSLRPLKMLPVDHYMTLGWKKGYNPSIFFDGNFYLKKHNKKVNPLLHFLKNGRFSYSFGFERNVYPISEETIKNYWKNKKHNKKVVYMCITGNYDPLEEIKSYVYVDPEWDYVCFTDNFEYIKAKKIGIWKIRPLFYTKSDNTRNNRWHKFFPHILFPNYSESIYIDSNINILTPYLFEEIKRRNQEILLPNHATTFSVYNELLWGLKSGIDDPVLIMKECLAILKEGHPFNYGKPECNIIYRRHDSFKVKYMMQDWWKWYSKYAKRDQFCFAHVLWKYHYNVSKITFVNTRIAYKDFCVFLHPNERLTTDV